MKKTLTSTGSRTTRKAKRQNVEAKAQSAKALRTVGDQEAFYFYEEVGKPTGQNAKNLNDFLESVKNVKAESLAFHLQRKDFQNWAEKILGDAKLAREIGAISAANSDDIRMLISEIVQHRIKELKQSSSGLIVSENSVFYLPATWSPPFFSVQTMDGFIEKIYVVDKCSIIIWLNEKEDEKWKRNFGRAPILISTFFGCWLGGLINIAIQFLLQYSIPVDQTQIYF